MQKIKKIVDLTHNLTNGTVVYPGDPEPNITVATTLEKEGYNLSRVIVGTQSGSHVDAPYHFRNEGSTIDKMDLKLFMGNAVVINVNYKKANEMVTLEEVLPYEEKINKCDIVLFRFDWYKKIGTEEFFDHPFLSGEVGEFLLEKGIMTVATDCINLDSTGGTEFPLHDMYAQGEGIIAENLAHFDEIDFEDPFVIFLPLKLIGVDGSPVRAVAVQFE
ncbi:cyclase family protein [Sinanaerobacter chloroacetimidivorans]|uniref:Cyclase family protein n=1 Tax=Sinanaerobacter chloroacetimidivorans TaxID=2818044 RepID=A0A8J7W347_9FIRM|nr:cyclase family protein [Sinanaerobacter chloroacetimidivorans]MBR0598395.1 cyclase family protein [Sinanaerobacter chloroacetimidivorans]